MIYSPERFDELRREIGNRREEIMKAKGSEYAPGGDRLKNFHEIAAFMGISSSEVALVYLLKHIQSIKEAVRTGRIEWYWETTTGEGLKQRVADAMNLLEFVAACIDEEVAFVHAGDDQD